MASLANLPSWPTASSMPWFPMPTTSSKTIWPFNLAVFYPHPGRWPVWDWALAAGSARGRHGTGPDELSVETLPLDRMVLVPGTLVPVIGIVQVGAQAMADRYTYLPLTGIFVMVVWLSGEFPAASPLTVSVRAAASGALVAVLLFLTHTQVGYWRTSVSLFERALVATGRNYKAHNHWGGPWPRLGEYDEAIVHFRRAIEYCPTYMRPYNHLDSRVWSKAGLARP